MEGQGQANANVEAPYGDAIAWPGQQKGRTQNASSRDGETMETGKDRTFPRGKPHIFGDAPVNAGCGWTPPRASRHADSDLSSGSAAAWA